MPRGGKRKGAGRKSGWNSGKTKAVKLPESLIPEIVEFAKVIDSIAGAIRHSEGMSNRQSRLVDGLYGREKVEDLDRLVDILFEEVNYSDVLERIAKKLLSSSIKEDTATQTSSPVPQPSLVHVAINDENDNLSLDAEIAEVLTVESEEKFTDPQRNEDSPDAECPDSAHNSDAVIVHNGRHKCLGTPQATRPPLTEDQSAALEKMKQFIQTPRQKYFRLTGYAGTGKSYLIVQLMKWLLNQKINFVAGSPTNKAVKNLKKLAAEAKVSVEAHTVSQLLGQQPELNEATGKEEFISQGTDSIGSYQVALIDEFSMISKSNFKDINQAVWHTQTKIIFVGDEGGANAPDLS